MPQRRQSHVYRVYQTDDDGNVVDDLTWVDVMRIDVVSTKWDGKPALSGQIVNYFMDWQDDTPNVQERTYTKLQVEDPDDVAAGLDPSDPNATTIALPIIHRTRFNFPANELGIAGQAVNFSFNNRNVDGSNGTPSKRKVHAIRVPNNDLNGEITMPKATIGEPQPATPGGGKPYETISWDDYAQALQDGTIDDTQYVDVEVTDHFSLNFPFANDLTSNQLVAFSLKNMQKSQSDPVGVEDDVLMFSAPPGDSTGTVYRTDPFQTIVNVSWGGLAVEFGDKDQDSPNDGSNAPSGGGGP